MSEESAEPELPRAVALAWGIAANPQRGPKRELSIERIVEVAMQLADAGGLASVSMAAVATELGFTPMSLYRYVSAKDDLVLLMQESGVGVPPESIVESAQDGGWRPGMRAWATEQLVAYADHPWLLDIPISSMPITPNNLAWFDAALEVLGSTALSADDKTSVVLAVEVQARWEATVRRGYSGGASDSPEARDAALLASLITREEFPAVAAAMEAGAFTPGAGGDPFVFGLERVLDGIEAYLRTPSATATPMPPPEIDPLDREAARDPRYKEAVKARREAEKKVREARKRERELLKAAKEKLAR